MDIPISCRMVAFGLVFLLPISPSFSQQNKPLAGIIEDLKSSNGQTRFAAYSKVKSNKEILRAPEVKNALIDLLDRENQVYRNPAENYGEGFVEYVTDLLDTVEVFADWNDAHQACVMAHSAYGTHSAFATELATKGGENGIAMSP